MNASLTRFEALCAAIERAGTQEAFAEAVGVAQPTVSRWVHTTKQLPAEYVLAAEALTGISRHDLRPDIYPRTALVDQAATCRFTGTDRRAAGDRRHLLQA